MNTETGLGITETIGGEAGSNISLNKEVLKPFTGIVEVVDTFPPEIKLDSEAQQYITPSESDDMKYFLAKEGDSVVGFAVCQFPEAEGAEPLFTYRYVFPEHRRRGVGQILRNEVYKWLVSHDYHSVGSGINGVLKIQNDGSVVASPVTDEDGGWKSYLSMTRTSPDTRIKHKLTSVVVDKEGLVDLEFKTALSSDPDSDSDLLPTQADELLKKLFDSGVIPQGLTPTDILATAQKETVVAYTEGRQLTFKEWLKRLRSR